MTRRISGLILVLAVAVAVFTAAACGPAAVAGSVGPLAALTVGGQPYVALSATVVIPGESADAEAYVVNSAPGGQVQVTGVAPVTVPGVAVGRIVHTGIQASGVSVAAMRDWPPVAVRSFVGAWLPAGRSGIVFAIAGQQPGHNYAVAGLRVEYTYAGRSYSVLAWGGSVACIAVTVTADVPSCEPFQHNVNDAVEKMAGISG